MIQMEPRSDLICFEHDGKKYAMTTKEIEAAVSCQNKQKLKIDMLKNLVDSYCTAFIRRAIYGECKAFCPFHALNNKEGDFPMCSARYIEDHPERVWEMLKRAGVSGLEE